MNNEDLRLAIHNILLFSWDPIGVKDNLKAQNEYDNYIPGIIKLIKANVDVNRMKSHLIQIQQVSMGFSVASLNIDEVAKQLVQLSN